MQRFALLLIISVFVDAATFAKKTYQNSVTTPNEITWILDGDTWRSSSGPIGLALTSRPLGSGALRVNRDGVFNGNPSQTALAVTISRSGFALIDLGLTGHESLADLLLEEDCVVSLHQNVPGTRQMESYLSSHPQNSSLSSLYAMPLWVETKRENCTVSHPNPIQAATALGGGNANTPAEPHLRFAPTILNKFGKPTAELSATGTITLQSGQLIIIHWQAQSSGVGRFEASLIFDDGRELALSGQELAADQLQAGSFPLYADVVKSRATLSLRLLSQGTVVAEKLNEVQILAQSGLALQDQLGTLILGTSSPLVRPSVSSTTSAKFTPAPSEFTPAITDKIKLLLSGEGVTPQVLEFSGTTTSARLQLPLGAKATIRLEYLDSAGDLIKVGENTVDVSPSMSPIALKPVPSPLPEIIASHESGYFRDGFELSLSVNNASLFFTLDGTDPKSSPSTRSTSSSFSTRIETTTVVRAYVERDGVRSGTRNFSYVLESVPAIRVAAVNPAKLSSGFFQDNLELQFLAVSGRPGVRLSIDGQVVDLPYTASFQDTFETTYSAVTEHGFLSAVPQTLIATKAYLPTTFLSYLDPTTSVDHLFAGTGILEIPAPEPGYSLRLTTDSTLPSEQSPSIDLPATLVLDESTEFAVQYIHPSGLVSEVFTRRFEKVPLPDPADLQRNFLVDEDSELAIDLISLGVNPDLIINPDLAPEFGSLQVTGHEISYSPNSDFFGADSFSLEFLHSSGLYLLLGFGVEVAPINDAPVFLGQALLTTPEDVALELDVNAIDVDGDSLSVTLVSPPSLGQVVFTSSSVQFLPNSDINGLDQLSLSISDGALTTEVTYTIDIQAINDPPIAAEMVIEVDEDSFYLLNLSATDPEGDTLSFEVLDLPSNGNAAAIATAVIQYSPSPDFYGADSFIALVSDGTDSVTTEVLVNVLARNDYPKILFQNLTEPSLNTLSIEALEDTTLTFSYVLSDIDGDLPAISSASSITLSVLNYSLEPLSDLTGLIHVIAPPDFSGIHEVEVEICDNSSLPPSALCTSTMLGLNYAPVNDAPITTPVLELTGNEDESLIAQLQALDPEGEALEFTVESQALYGALTLDISGDLEYTPYPDFFGQDSFVYRVSDPQGLFATATVLIEVVNQPDSPKVGLFSDSLFQTEITSTDFFEDAAKTIYVLAFDVDSDLATISSTPTLNDPSVSLSYFPSSDLTSAELILEPEPDFYGPVTLSVSTCDSASNVLCTTQSFTLNFQEVNDLPLLVGPNPLSVLEDVTLTGVFSAIDPELDDITFDLDSGPSLGSITISASGEFSYSPQTDVFGLDSFILSLDDGQASTQTTVFVEILPQNDYPTILGYSDDARTVPLLSSLFYEDEPLTIYFAALDVDGDIATLSATATISLTGADLSLYTSTDPDLAYAFISLPTDFFGPVEVSISACDSSTLPPQSFCTTEVLSFNVVAVNDAPVLSHPLFLSLNEDEQVTGVFTSIDTDLDVVQFSLVEQADFGVATVNSDGSFTFLPTLNFFGDDDFTVELSDSTTSILVTIPLQVFAQNDPPEILAFSDVERTIPVSSGIFLEDEPFYIYFAAVDLDGELASLDSTATVNVTAVELSYYTSTDPNLGEAFVFAEPDFFGPLDISISACDTSTLPPQSWCTTQVFSLEIAAINDEPILLSSTSLTGLEDTTLVTELLAFDVEEHSVSFTIVTPPASGDATLSPTGHLVYSPSLNFHGLVSVGISLTDTAGAIAYTDLEILVEPYNDKPILALFHDANQTIPVTAPDFLEDSTEVLYYEIFDLEGHDVSISSSSVLTGFLSLEVFDGGPTSGTIFITPDANWYGPATVQFQICDNTNDFPGALCDFEAVSFNFLSINDSPYLTTYSDPGFTLQSSTISFSEDSSGVLYFLTDDVELDPVSITLDPASTSTGLFELLSSTLSFTPSTNWYGVQTVTLEVCDVSAAPPGNLCSASLLEFTVLPVNDAPIISFFSDPGLTNPTSQFDLLEDSSTSIYFSVAAIETDTISLSLANSLTSGNLSLDVTGSQLTLVTSANYFGLDEAHIEFCELNPAAPPVLCSTHVLPIVVHSVNDAPTISVVQALPLSGVEDSNLSFDIFVLDVEADPLTITISTPPGNGTVTHPLTGSGNAIYIPYPNEWGPDSFTLSVSDGALSTDQTIGLSLAFVPDPPAISWPGFVPEVAVGFPKLLDALVLDPDMPNDSLSLTWIITNSPLSNQGIVNNPTSTNAEFIATYPGKYDLELSVLDSYGLSDTQSFEFVTKDSFVLNSAFESPVNTPIFITASSFAKEVFVAHTDGSNGTIRMLTGPQQSMGIIAGTIPTTSPRLSLAHSGKNVMVAFRDSTSQGHLSVKRAPDLTKGLDYLGVKGVAVVTNDAFDLISSSNGTPILCYSKGQLQNKPACLTYDKRWQPLGPLSSVINSPDTTLLQAILKPTGRLNLVHSNGQDLKAHEWDGFQWLDRGSHSLGQTPVDLQAFVRNAVLYAMIRFESGEIQVYVNNTGSSWSAVSNPVIGDAVSASFRADHLGVVQLFVTHSDGQLSGRQFIPNSPESPVPGTWSLIHVSPPGISGGIVASTRRFGQTYLIHNPLNSVPTLEVTSYHSRFPMLVDAVPAPGGNAHRRPENITLFWNRPLLAGSESEVSLELSTDPGELGAAKTYGSAPQITTTLDPSADLSSDRGYLIKVSQSLQEIQGENTLSELIIPFRSETTKGLLGAADYNVPDSFTGGMDQFSFAIRGHKVDETEVWAAYATAAGVQVKAMDAFDRTWSNRGTFLDGFDYPAIAFRGSTPYMLARYTDGSAMSSLRYNGTSWVLEHFDIAGAGVHPIVHRFGPSINGADPIQYGLTLRGGTYALQLWKYQGTWQLVGGGNLLDGITNHYDFTVLDDGKPVVAFLDPGNNLIVQSFNGTSWVSTVANLPFPNASLTYVQLGSFKQRLFLAAKNEINDFIWVATYDIGVGGAFWDRIDNDAILQPAGGGALFMNMDLVEGIPYLVYGKVSDSSMIVCKWLNNPQDPDLWSQSLFQGPGPNPPPVSAARITGYQGQPFVNFSNNSNYNLSVWNSNK